MLKHPRAGSMIQKVLSRFAVFAVASVCAWSVQAQSQQMMQELLRGSALGTVPSVGARPNPARAAEPVPLQGAQLVPRVERVCKFEGADSVQQNTVSETGIRNELYKPNNFERYVRLVTGKELCRFGFNAGFGSTAFFEPPPLALIPDDYVLGPGDEVFIRVWGSLELDFAAVIDRSGQVVLPKVGPVKLAGVSHGKAASVLKGAIQRIFSDFDASLTIGQLRGIRVYITGYAERPGALTVNNLASLSSVVFSSGGPSNAGSFRNIELRRKGQVIASLDLYALLLEGDKSADRPLLSEDVIHFAPIGPQVALVGGVNKPAVFELKGSETATDLVRMAGNFAPGGRLGTISRLSISNRDEGFQALASGTGTLLADGDIVMVSDRSMLEPPKDRMVKRVVIQGQVRKPGEYFLPPEANLKQAIDAAGGLVPGAFLYGIKLSRQSVLEEQRQMLARVLRELDRDLVSQAAMRPTNQQEASVLTAQMELGRSMLNRLQSFQPEGRLALPINFGDSAVPEVELHDGDTVSVPTVPASIGVYGSVVNAGTYLFDSSKKLSDYLQMAGGATKGADVDQLFVIRANGQARHIESRGAFFSRKANFDATPNPGDTIVVPENMDKTTFTRELVTYTQILYQLGLGAAAIKVLQD